MLDFVNLALALVALVNLCLLPYRRRGGGIMPVVLWRFDLFTCLRPPTYRTPRHMNFRH
jgi:hypothetical protein